MISVKKFKEKKERRI